MPHRLQRAGFFTLLWLLSAAAATAQAPACKYPISRARWHDLIDREQAAILRLDGKADSIFKVSADDDVNFMVTHALTRRVDDLQCEIERDPQFAHPLKVTYLDGAVKLLKAFGRDWRRRAIAGTSLPVVVDLYAEAFTYAKDKHSIESLIEAQPHGVGSLVLGTGAFATNPGFTPSKHSLIKKYTLLYPDKILATLHANPGMSFQDSLIRVAAYKHPRQLYDYAAANNALGAAIRKIDDPLIQAVSKMATSGGSGQLQMPFLDGILKGRITVAEVNKVKDNPVQYYKLLVRTRIDYLTRMLQGDTAMEMRSLNDMLVAKAKDPFIKEINGLHEEPDPKRFRILQGLSAEELYYLGVSTESELYTSSFVRGIYPLMMQKSGNRGDSLLSRVRGDRFKKFIKMAAGYNQLGGFLATFPKEGDAAGKLMTAFVNGLETSPGLEDGVDVADSYASIAESLQPVAARMLENVKRNLDRNRATGNERGVVIYNLLHKLFLSADSSNKIDLSQEFGIPPVYTVPYASLATDTGAVVAQVFFYGDKDGKMYFPQFLTLFPSAAWKRSETPQWVAFTSTKGKPTRVYVNKPLPEETGDDSKAQMALSDFLSANRMEPTIVVHRGHSYYADFTIKQLTPSAKIAYLGSCGGYYLINEVLKRAPEAHIIASKQIGRGSINREFMQVLNTYLLAGRNIDWQPFWKDFAVNAGKVEGFSDYIPPYKNLGAIFIKVYNSLTPSASTTL